MDMTTTHETFVSLELAKELYKLGFRWRCRYGYWRDELSPFGYNIEEATNVGDWNGSGIDAYSAPTLAVVQKWLIEELNYVVYVMPTVGLYFARVRRQPTSDEPTFGGDFLDTDSYNTYDKALERGIEKYIDLIKRIDKNGPIEPLYKARAEQKTD